jgi:hypothetical protein
MKRILLLVLVLLLLPASAQAAIFWDDDFEVPFLCTDGPQGTQTTNATGWRYQPNGQSPNFGCIDPNGILKLSTTSLHAISGTSAALLDYWCTGLSCNPTDTNPQIAKDFGVQVSSGSIWVRFYAMTDPGFQVADNGMTKTIYVWPGGGAGFTIGLHKGVSQNVGWGIYYPDAYDCKHTRQWTDPNDAPQSDALFVALASVSTTAPELVEYDIHLNTPGQTDGYVKIYQAGTLVFDSGPRAFRGPDETTYGCHGALWPASWYADRTQIFPQSGLGHLYIDRLAFGNQQIGPVGGSPPSTISYYVSPTGSDSANGSFATPFQTLGKAQTVVRGVNGNMSGDIYVYLRGGTYTLGSALALTSADSGTNGHNVVWSGYPGDPLPTISGGMTITGWSSVGGGIYKATGVTQNFRQLYVNGVRATRARSPNLGANYPAFVDIDTNDDTAIVRTADVPTFQNFTGVEMRTHLEWEEHSWRLTSVANQGNGTTKLGMPVGWAGSDFAYFKANSYCHCIDVTHYWFENDRALVDVPGEWYLNQATDELFYMPRVGEDMSTALVIAPTQRQLVTIIGTAGTPVQHIQFYGVSFAHTNWTDPDNGLIATQADWIGLPVSEVPVSAVWAEHYFPYEAVYVSYAQNLRFERNLFVHLGSQGLKMEKGTQTSSVVGNVFYDIAAGGFAIYCPSTYSVQNDRCLNNTITNNYFYQIGRDYHSAVALFTGYTQGSVIEYNEIEDSPYTGISSGWGWTLTQVDQGGASIRYNRIHNVMTELCDGAGIYTQSAQSPEMFIDSNYIYDIRRPQGASSAVIAGVYNDDGSSNITVSNNVIQNLTGMNTSALWTNVHGTLTWTNNGGADPTTMANAGIQAAFIDIKLLVGSTEVATPAFVTHVAVHATSFAAAYSGPIQAVRYWTNANPTTPTTILPKPTASPFRVTGVAWPNPFTQLCVQAQRTDLVWTSQVCSTNQTQDLIQWTEASSTYPATGFHIEFSRDGASFSQVMTVTGGPGSTIQLVPYGPTDLTRYYRIHAFNAYGDSLYNTTVQAPPDTSSGDVTPPATPTNFGVN